LHRGLILGVLGAYLGGRTDQLIQRLMDVLLSFRSSSIAIAVVAALGTGEGEDRGTSSPRSQFRSFRASRGSCARARLSIVNMPYIEATRACRIRAVRIMSATSHRTVFGAVSDHATAFLGQAILLEASPRSSGSAFRTDARSVGLMLRAPACSSSSSSVARHRARRGDRMAVFGFNLFATRSATRWSALRTA